MEARVQKWGNSLALRIPKPFAAEVGIEDDSPVEIELQKGKLVITPVFKPRLALEDILSRITEENLHRESPTGSAVGREIW